MHSFEGDKLKKKSVQKGQHSNTSGEDAPGEELVEELISAWIKVYGVLRASRIIAFKLTYNEAVAAFLVYRAGEKGISAKKLGEETGMLKSQVNRTLNSLEEMGFITRKEDPVDRRSIIVRATENKRSEFMRVHAGSQELARKIIDVIGTGNAWSFVEIARRIEQAGLSLDGSGAEA